MGVVLLVAGIWSSVEYWDWLRTKTPITESDTAISTASNGETLRNVGLLIGGALAFVFALWRGWVAERQAGTAQQSLLNERYQKGAEMLGSDVLSVRLGGIYALERLAAEAPKEYHIQVMKLFCAFVRHPTQDKQYDLPPSNRRDVQDIMEVISARSESGVRLERDHGFKLELSSADLRGIRLIGSDLSHAILTNSALSHAWLVDANLSSAWLDGANLYGARLGGANLSDADLWSTNLAGAFLVQAPDDQRGVTVWKHATGLTQGNLDSACADPDNPPFLDGVVDAETSKPLVWRGQACDDEP